MKSNKEIIEDIKVTRSDLTEKIEKLIKQRKSLGEYRVSCANLGRGVTDSILRDMERIDDEIRILQGLMEDEL